jgi:hypothetical protein
MGNLFLTTPLRLHPERQIWMFVTFTQIDILLISHSLTRNEERGTLWGVQQNSLFSTVGLTREDSQLSAQETPISCAGKKISCAGNLNSLRRNLGFSLVFY